MQLGPGEPISAIKERIRHIYFKKAFIHHLRPSDVFIVGHPKSGNTWLAYMLAVITHRDFEHRVTLANLQQFIPAVHGNDAMISNFKQLPAPRIFRNEWPVYPRLYPKTIYLVRNPMAVLVSYFHHYRAVTGNDRLTLEGFVQEYLTHGCLREFEPKLARWDRQVLEWLDRSKSQRVMIVKYEEMVRDRRHVLEAVVDFVQIPCSTREVNLAVDRGSFEAMRLEEEQYGAESYPGEIRRRGKFIRQGRVDGWKEEMPLHLADQVREKFYKAMQAVGYIH